VILIASDMDSGELELQYRRERFMTILKAHSNDKEDPVSEWRIINFPSKDQLKSAINYIEWLDLKQRNPQRCICSTQIDNRSVIINSMNGKLLIVGAVCLKRWLDLKAICDGCGCTLGNFVKRQADNDWLCRVCKAEEKRRAMAFAAQMEERKKQREREQLNDRIAEARRIWAEEEAKERAQIIRPAG
jgi:ribosomal protein L37AE/L43A